jgi:hypothetical protein
MEPTANPPAIVGEAVAGRSAKLRAYMRELALDLTKNTFDLAEAFASAQESHCYLEWGFESLGEYATLDLGIKHRKAQYLARIVRVCREAGVSRKDYEPAGVTKLREITTLDPGITYYNTETKIHEPMVEHIVGLIAEAPELSTLEVEEKVATLKGMTGENSMVLRSYKITKSAWENTFETFFEAMRKQLGSKGRDGTGAAQEYSDGACLEFCLRDWLNDPNNFLEETDESKEQIEVPWEGTLGQSSGDSSSDRQWCGSVTGEQLGKGSEVLPGAAGFASDVIGASGTLDDVDSEEIPQDTFQKPLQHFQLPTED